MLQRCLRLALLLTIFCISHGFSSGQATIEIEINNTPQADDDYFGWSPIPSRIRSVGSPVAINVRVESSKRTTGGTNGEVHFGPFSVNRPTPSTWSASSSLSVTLPSNGAWKNFWVAGKESSSDGQDVTISAVDAGSGMVLGTRLVMVRVRKDAESLTAIEIERFLAALTELHDINGPAKTGANSKYLKYVHIHGEAFTGTGIHRDSAFPTWHRTMLLSLERELQSIDPRVALPYWKFDKPTTKLFTPQFIGKLNAVTGIVQFSNSNPMRFWKMPANSAISNMTVGGPNPQSTFRLARFDDGATPANVSPSSVLNSMTYALMHPLLEQRYHDSAHTKIGGWLGSAQSPKDPLFFLLHANVDRAWAEWQKGKSKFDETDVTAFSPQGIFAPGASHQGNFRQDSQWPWNLNGGNQGTTDPSDDWPEFTFSLPPSPANHGPALTPLTGETLDFMDVLPGGLPHGYCYDKIPY